MRLQSAKRPGAGSSMRIVIVPDVTARHSGAPQSRERRVAARAPRIARRIPSAAIPSRCHAAYELLWFSLIQYRRTSARVFDSGRPLTVTSTAAAGPAHRRRDSSRQHRRAAGASASPGRRRPATSRTPDTDDVVERDGAGALGRDPARAHHPEHPEDVQHRLVDAVRREVAEPGEVGLILELERPRHRARAG